MGEAPLPGFRFAVGLPELIARDDAGGSVRIVRLSAGELAFVADPPPRVGELRRLDLPGMVPLNVRVTDARQVGAEHVTIAELPDATLADGRTIASLVRRLMGFRAGLLDDDFTVEREQIRGEARVRELVRALFANRRPGRLRRLDRHDGKGVRLQPARLMPESDTPLQWEAEDPLVAPPFAIELDGYISRFRFVVERTANVDGFLAVPLPASVERVRSRRQRRVPAPPDVTVVFRHPRWPQLRIERAVRNVSWNGLSFATSVVKDLIHPGLRIPSLEVIWQDRLVCRLRGEVRHVSEDIDAPSELAGLAIDFASDDDAIHWRERVSRLLHPEASADGTWSEPLWELYRDSAYFSLSHKSEADFARLREPFEAGSRKLARAPELGVQVVWPSSRGVEASLSILRIYQHSSFLYQLARRPGRAPLRFPGRQVLRDIYLRGVESLIDDASLRWLIVWVQEEARFSRLVHHTLPMRYVESGRAEVQRFRALEGFCELPRVEPAPGLELVPATSTEVEAVLAALASRHSRAYLEAHDLIPERFGLVELKRGWARARLSRDRQVLVARRRGRALAAAIVELADDGLHLFGLLDLVRIVPLTDAGPDVKVALVEAARELYAARGKHTFVCFHEGPPDELRGARLHDLGAADLTLLPAELLPELLEHVYEVTSPRDQPRWPE